MGLKDKLTTKIKIPDLSDVAIHFQGKSKTDGPNMMSRLKNEDIIPPDKYEKISSKLLNFDNNYKLTKSVAKGVPTLAGGLYLTNKASDYLDEKQKEKSKDIKDKSDEIDKRFSLIKQLRNKTEPEKHPDPTFLEKHGNSLSLAGGAAAAGLGAYALKKYLDKKKAKKNA